MTTDNVLASVAVKDLKSAGTWYEKLFRSSADSTRMPEVAEWKFERCGWLQVYQLRERAGGGSCTLAVRTPTRDFINSFAACIAKNMQIKSFSNT
jgi:hypothetical protein